MTRRPLPAAIARNVGTVVAFPRPPFAAQAGTQGKPRAQVIAEFIAERCADCTVAEVYEALLVVLAGIGPVNAINRTEALELAQAVARDLGETVANWLAREGK